MTGWGQGGDVVDALILRGEIERVPVNVPAAHVLVAKAGTHLSSAAALAGRGPDMREPGSTDRPDGCRVHFSGRMPVATQG